MTRTKNMNKTVENWTKILEINFWFYFNKFFKIRWIVVEHRKLIAGNWN